MTQDAFDPDKRIITESLVNMLKKHINESSIKGTEFIVMFYYPDGSAVMIGSPDDKNELMELAMLTRKILLAPRQALEVRMVDTPKRN